MYLVRLIGANTTQYANNDNNDNNNVNKAVHKLNEKGNRICRGATIQVPNGMFIIDPLDCISGIRRFHVHVHWALAQCSTIANVQFSLE